MGILNITTNSFSDGGSYLNKKKALDRALAMIDEGVDIIDVGGESTKPQARPVPTTTELKRVLPIIENIRAHSDICISIDTYKPEVMQQAINSGANIINDVTALRTPNALEVASRLNAPVCLMHMQGKPQNMQNSPLYTKDPIIEINDFFSERINSCLNAGILKSNLILDPGFGFGKLVKHNLIITKRIKEFKKHKLPLLLGVSRKSTIGTVLNEKIETRLNGSLALTAYAILNGVTIIRTHDVKPTLQVIKMIKAVTEVV